MKNRVLAALALLAAPAVAAAAPAVPYLPVPKDAAVILNTGSTNTTGYRIVVQQSGKAEFVDGSTRATGQIPLPLAAKFFRDLSDAMPLSTLPREQCMKSASFGTSLFVWWRGQRSPDLSCPGDAKAQALGSDAAAVAQALHVSSGLRSRAVPMLPNEPRMPIP